MQSVFQPGQFRLAAIQPSQQNSNAQELLSSVSPNQTLKADVLSATLQQISQQVNQQQQTIAQYKAQIIIQGKVLDILTQFPLDQGDQLELKVTQDKQLTIDKVTPQSQRTDSAASPIDPKSLLNTGKVLMSAAEQASLVNDKASSTSNTATPSPITAEQINKVIQMWLSQSRPSSGVLLDLSITMEAVAEIIKQLPNAPQLNPLQINPTSGGEQVKASPLSNLLLVIAQSIQKDIFSRLPHAGQNDFKSNVQQLIKELITWQPQDSSAKTATTNQPSHPAHTQVHAVAQGQTTQQTLINSLITLQSMIDQALNRSTLTTQPSAVSNAVHSGIQALSNTTETGAFNTPPSTTQPAPQLSILRDWTQVLALMAPTTQSQPDLLDWMLESIRRLAGTQAPSDISTATNKSTQEALTQAKAATQNPSNAQATNPQLLNTETHRAIDSSQWLRLAEFRKHQLFTGNVKQSLLQGTTDLQINNVLRQMLVNVEELTGRMSAMRLASGGSQVETNTPNHIHLDLPIITNTGPTNVSIDITDEHSNTSESGDNTKKEKNQWLVHLKFELPPLAPFIGQIIYDTDKNHLTANFYSDHQETLSLLNEHLIDLETQCQSFLASELSLNTRFGMINMPRESIVKTTNHSVSVKV